MCNNCIECFKKHWLYPDPMGCGECGRMAADEAMSDDAIDEAIIASGEYRASEVIEAELEQIRDQLYNVADCDSDDCWVVTTSKEQESELHTRMLQLTNELCISLKGEMQEREQF